MNDQTVAAIGFSLCMICTVISGGGDEGDQSGQNKSHALTKNKPDSGGMEWTRSPKKRIRFRFPDSI